MSCSTPRTAGSTSTGTPGIYSSGARKANTASPKTATIPRPSLTFARVSVKHKLGQVSIVNHLTVDDKIRFWRDVMQYAKDRGIDIYWYTWNIFVWGTEGKHGITEDGNNPETIAYFRASVRETVKTYPLLAGIGITAGENMSSARGPFDHEAWLWKT